MSKTILETERLVLEQIDEHHRHDVYTLLSNEKVHQYFPHSYNETESREFYERVRRNYIMDGYSFWAVIRKSDNLFLGICGLLKQVIEDREETEVGYRFLDTYWGNGYGTEAADGCMMYAKEKLGKKSVISLIREENVPSIRVAENNGLHHEREILFHGMPHRIYRYVFTIMV